MFAKRTKIVATIGPASESPRALRALLSHGMNAARLNMSHGSHEEHALRIQRIREAENEHGAPVPILVDLSGPKIRTGEYVTDRITIVPESTLVLTTVPCTGDESRIYVNYERLASEVAPGTVIMLDDGKKRLEVIRIDGHDITCRVIVGGELKSRRGVNIPGAYLSIETITDKDRSDITFAVSHGADYIALSFVRRAQDVVELKELIREAGGVLPVIAKIETMESIENLDEILAEADGVMVARGDLAIEVPAEMVPIYQKRIIKKANELGKPVIIATQMLESMIHAPIPTRAEVSDIATAVYDGADAVMLSEESALGTYAVEAVATMCRVASTIEHSMQRPTAHPSSVPDSIAESVYHVARDVGAKAIIALTERGVTAQRVARFKPDCPIIALTPHDTVLEKLALVRGVYPFKVEPITDFGSALAKIPAFVRTYGIAEPGDRIAVTAGAKFGASGSTNMLLVLTV
ncbi:pyruvate kinase [Patescibacteria group bacterium]|nr:pyruvate kinase [Patescibacteria group bacterium]